MAYSPSSAWVCSTHDLFTSDFRRIEDHVSCSVEPHIIVPIALRYEKSK